MQDDDNGDASCPIVECVPSDYVWTCPAPSAAPLWKGASGSSTHAAGDGPFGLGQLVPCL